MVVKPSEQRAPAVNDEELVRQQIAECGKYNTETEVEEMMGQYKAYKVISDQRNTRIRPPLPDHPTTNLHPSY
jgi:hypothetical protein